MAYIGKYNTVMLDSDNFFFRTRIRCACVPASNAPHESSPAPNSEEVRKQQKAKAFRRRSVLLLRSIFWLFADPEMRKRQADTAYFSPILLHGCPLRRKLPFSASSLRSDAEPKAGSRAVKGVSVCRNVRFRRTDGDDRCPVQLQASAHQG